MRRTVRWIAAVVMLTAIVSCKGGIEDDPILVLSSAEALAEGKRLMEEEKYRQARDYLIHAFEVEPNSAGGREALLLAADAYFLQGGSENYIRAESKYRDFQTRFPTSDRAAYVQFQIASSLMNRLGKPDRDQRATREALVEMGSVIELYPTSEYVSQAQEQISVIRQHLAEHELGVGNFYYRYRNYNGARQRLEFLLETYPEFERSDQALFLLGMSYLKAEQPDESASAFERLRQEYPDSEFVKKIPES